MPDILRQAGQGAPELGAVQAVFDQVIAVRPDWTYLVCWKELLSSEAMRDYADLTGGALGMSVALGIESSVAQFSRALESARSLPASDERARRLADLEREIDEFTSRGHHTLARAAKRWLAHLRLA